MIPTITTERLRLRPFIPSDAAAMHQIMNGENVLRYFPNAHTPPLEQVQRIVDRTIAHWQEKGYGLWAMELRSTGVLLGRCGLQHIPETDEVEIDFILDRNQWGRGFATEAGQASLDYGYGKLSMEMIIGIVHPENIASQRVLKKLKMQFAEESEYFGMACYRYLGKRPFTT